MQTVQIWLPRIGTYSTCQCGGYLHCPRKLGIPFSASRQDWGWDLSTIHIHFLKECISPQTLMVHLQHLGQGLWVLAGWIVRQISAEYKQVKVMNILRKGSYIIYMYKMMLMYRKAFNLNHLKNVRLGLLDDVNGYAGKAYLR